MAQTTEHSARERRLGTRLLAQREPALLRVESRAVQGPRRSLAHGVPRAAEPGLHVFLAGCVVGVALGLAIAIAALRMAGGAL